MSSPTNNPPAQPQNTWCDDPSHKAKEEMMKGNEFVARKYCTIPKVIKYLDDGTAYTVHDPVWLEARRREHGAVRKEKAATKAGTRDSVSKAAGRDQDSMDHTTARSPETMPETPIPRPVVTASTPNQIAILPEEATNPAAADENAIFESISLGEEPEFVRSPTNQEETEDWEEIGTKKTGSSENGGLLRPEKDAVARVKSVLHYFTRG